MTVHESTTAAACPASTSAGGRTARACAPRFWLPIVGAAVLVAGACMRITWLALSDRGNAVQPEFATLGGPQGNEASTRSGEPSNPGRSEAIQPPGALTGSGASNGAGPNAGSASANAGSSTPDSTAAKSASSGAAGTAANPSGKSAGSTTGTAARTETRTFRKEGPQGALRITYDDLDLKLIAGI